MYSPPWFFSMSIPQQKGGTMNKLNFCMVLQIQESQKLGIVKNATLTFKYQEYWIILFEKLQSGLYSIYETSSRQHDLSH